MAKVDIVIGAVAVLALLATGLGIAIYDDGLTDYTVTTSEQDLGTLGPTAVDGQTTFQWTVPDNAYGATIRVNVAASGFARPDGDVSIALVITTPDGVEHPPVTGGFAFGAGNGAVETDITWAMVPEDFAGTHDDEEAAHLHWDEPLLVKVIVDGPGASPIPVAPGQDEYDATASGLWNVYSISGPVPDVQAA